MEALLLIVMGVVNVLCFVIGAKVGQKVSAGEAVEIPKLDPLKAVRDHRAFKAEEKERTKMEAVLQNIEAYNGTAVGQKDIPG